MGSAKGRLIDPAGSLIIAGAYGAGLTTGLARFPDPLVVGLAAVAAALVVRGAPVRLTSIMLALGVGVGTIARHRAEISCAATLSTDRQTLRVALVDPGIASGRVRLASPGCHGAVTAEWPENRAIPAGVVATVMARWAPRPGPLDRPDGILRIDWVGSVTGRPGLIASSRNVVAERIGRLFGDRAPLVDALLAGRQGGIDRDLRDRFASAGMVHLLVISGFHVGLVAGWIVLLASGTGLPRAWGLRTGAILALGYAGWLGWPAPATRAAVLLLVATVGRLVQRRWRPDGTLGVALLAVLLIDPWAMTRVGAWLSFIALAGVVWATRWARQWWPNLRPWIEGLLASVGATLATAPVGAWIFGQVAPVGIVLNLVALPVAALLVPALVGAVLLVPVLPAMAEALAASAVLLLDALVWLGTWGSTLPGAGVRRDASVRAALPWILLLMVIHLTTRNRIVPRETLRRVAWILAPVFLITAVPVGSRAAPARGQLMITFLAVGQGDATVIRTPGGRWVVVDAGPSDDRYDAGARVVVPYLRARGARVVTLFVLSHGHRDHAGGAPALFRSLPVGLVLEPGEPAAEESYRGFLDAVIEHAIPWHAAHAGERITIDGVVFRVVHPHPGWSGQGRDLNEDSIVLEVRFGEFTALLPGDAGFLAESEFSGRLELVDVLKVGHHGSRSASGEAFLAGARPDAAVLSLGVNRYGHPAPETLARLEAVGASIWRTDRDGPVTLTTDGRTFRMRGRGRTADFSAIDP